MADETLPEPQFPTLDITIPPDLGYNYTPELEQAVQPLLEFFSHINVKGDILDLWSESRGDYQKMMELSKDLNATVICQWLDWCHRDPDPRYKEAYLNWVKLNLLLFTAVPWWRSRFGHMIWFFVCAADQHAYFPLVWEAHFDPRQWYKVGERQRPADDNKVSAFSLPD